MEAGHIAYFVYLIIMFILGVVLYSTDIYVNNWRYWVIIACIIGAYICGTFYGII